MSGAKPNFLSRTKVLHQLLFVLVIVLATIGVIAGILLTTKSEAIDVADSEITGVKYIQKIIPVIKFSQQRRGLSAAYFGGDPSAESKIQTAQSKLEDALGDLKSAQATYGDVLATGRYFDAVTDKWNALKARGLNMNGKESFAEHSALIEAVFELLAEARSISTLDLDPEERTYYLMATSLDILPGLTEDLGVARGKGAGIAARGVVTDLEKLAMLNLLGGVERAAESFDKNTDATFATNDLAKSKLSGQASDLAASLANVERLINDNFEHQGNAVDISAGDYFAQMTNAINQAYQMIDDGSAVLIESLEQRKSDLYAEETQVIIIILIGVAIILGVLLAVANNLRKSIARVQTIFDAIGEGDFSSEIPDMGDTEIGNLMKGLAALQAKLSADISETGRLKTALDSVSANVMMADENLNIVYMNDAVVGTLTEAEADIRKDLSNFDVKNLIGNNIDIFHKNPAHQRTMLANLTSTHNAEISVGGRLFHLTVSPVSDEDGKRIGTVVEWQDLTEIRKQEAYILRVKSALDRASANVMVADADENIVYMNDAVLGVLRNAEQDIRAVLPNFDVNNLLGKSIHEFHANPAHQKGILAKMSGTHRAEISVGPRKFSFIMNPINNEDGTRAGYVVEWSDVTEQRAIEAEVDAVVSAVVDGDLSRSIPLEGKEGFMRNLSEGINSLIQVVSSALTDVDAVLSKLATGDLTEQVEKEYKGTFGNLTGSLNATIDQLRSTVGQILMSSDVIRNSAQEIASGNTDMSQRTEEQASSLEETASSMEELTGTVKQNASNASQANQLASGAAKVAEEGGDVVGDAIKAMSEISASSTKISDIIGVIDEIAFQTNLLALNASVEAARAGEQGRGFAVVATEVRNLAQRSASAAKEIKDLIQDSVKKVSAGTDLVNKSGETLQEIVNSVKKVNDIISEIAAASQEQSSGIDQVNQAVMQMDEVTQQNAALAEEASATSETLSDQAAQLVELMGYFKTDEAAIASAPAQIAAPSAPRAAPAPASKPAKSAPPPIADDEGDEWEEF